MATNKDRDPRRKERRGSKKAFFTFLFGIIVVTLALIVTSQVYPQAFGSLVKNEEAKTVEQTIIPVTPSVSEEPAPEPTVESTAVAEPTMTPEPMPTPEPTAEPTVAPTPKIAPEPVVIPTPLPRPTLTPPPTPTSIPTPTSTPAPVVPSVEPAPSPRPEPRAPNFVVMEEFGEVIGEGAVELELQGRDVVDAKYTYQGKLSTGEFTLFFGLYNKDGELVWEVRVRDYKQGEQFKSVQIIQYYKDGSVRTSGLDREEGRSITVIHVYKLDPYAENIFSTISRSRLDKKIDPNKSPLVDRSATSVVGMHFDLSGFSDKESVVFSDYVEADVEAAFADVEELVLQIEEKRKTK